MSKSSVEQMLVTVKLILMKITFDEMLGFHGYVIPTKEFFEYAEER